jgi:CubicO group peptidase (beta-lactamase class C family)
MGMSPLPYCALTFAIASLQCAAFAETPAHQNSPTVPQVAADKGGADEPVQDGPALSQAKLTALEGRLLTLQQKYNVPGMSGAIAQGNKIIWLKPFGKADLEQNVAVTTNTVFPLASLTKPYAGTILLQLMENGSLSLDAPVADFGIRIPNSHKVTVRHILSHTSEGDPGTAYKYSGNRFRELDHVIAKLTGHTFPEELGLRILAPLRLQDTAPNPEMADACRSAGRSPGKFKSRLATGYQSDGKTVQPYPSGFSSAAGLVATPADVARFSIAWDENRLLKPETKALAFTALRDRNGKALPYGLGWFVFEQNGQKLIWHYGWWDGISSLIVKVPEKALTFVLLANSDMLSRPFNLGSDSNVYASEYASAFLDALGP